LFYLIIREILGITRKSETWFSFTLFKLDDAASIDIKCDLAVRVRFDSIKLIEAMVNNKRE